MAVERAWLAHSYPKEDAETASLGKQGRIPERRRHERRAAVVFQHGREMRLRFAAQAAGFGTYDVDCQSGDALLSPELKAMAGLPPEQPPLPEAGIAALIHPDDRQAFRAKFEASRQPQGSGHFEDECRIVRSDGEVRWVRIKGRTYFAADAGERRSVGASGVVMDITAERAAAQELLESRAQLAGLVDSMLDAVISIDAGQRIVLFNAAAVRMFRCCVAEAIGSPLERFIPARFRAAHNEHVKRFSEEGTTARAMGQPGVFRGLRADGEEFPIEASIAKVRVGGHRWLTVIVRDVTERMRNEEALRREAAERKSLEERLRQINVDLERRIGERTAELARANEALVRSNLDLQQFAYIAAHDLQTPLRSITGFAQLLQQECRGRGSAQADTWIDQLVEYTKRMHALIQDLLEYSRVDSRGRAFLPADLGQVFEEVVSALQPAIRESGASVTRDELPVVHGDRVQLGQVLQNLIENSIKYHGGRPPRVHVAAELRGREWLFSVSDNGIGIAEQHCERIFDIFRRLHTQQEYPGTGIGLAVCRRVIHRHGGRIWAESEPGVGSVFHFTLPDRRPAAP